MRYFTVERHQKEHCIVLDDETLKRVLLPEFLKATGIKDATHELKVNVSFENNSDLLKPIIKLSMLEDIL